MKIVLFKPIGLGRLELAEYFEKAFKKLGHKIYFLPYDENRFSRRLPIIKPLEAYIKGQNLLHKISSFQPDIVLTIGGKEISTETLIKLKQRLRIPLVNYFVDDVMWLNYSTKISPYYDFFFTNAPEAISSHMNAGAKNVYYLKYACDPEIHKTVYLTSDEKQKYQSDIVFVGTLDRYKLEILHAISDFNIKIFSPHFFIEMKDFEGIKHSIPKTSSLYTRITGYSVRKSEMVKVYNAARIALNITTTPGEKTTLMRPYEITACGTLLLSDKKKALSDSFVIDKEIVCYETVQELREKLSYYLEHPDEARELAQRAQKRAHSEHTYLHRAKELLDIVK